MADMRNREPELILTKLAIIYIVAFCFILATGAALTYKYGIASLVDMLGRGIGLPSPIDSGFYSDVTKTVFQSSVNVATALLLGAGAYLFAAKYQRRREDAQLSLDRFKILADLNAEINSVFGRVAIYDPNSVEQTHHRKLVFGLDRSTTWMKECDRAWRYGYGERTVRFVDASQVLRSDSDISFDALHDYLHWFRRLHIAIHSGILSFEDAHIYWRYLICWAVGSRFSFLSDLFSPDDMKDFSSILSGIIVYEAQSGKTNALRYLGGGSDKRLLEAIGPDARRALGLSERPPALKGPS